ncbi:MAG: glycosyltransferase family 2 protein [Verrucomicrobia bacterium]|nr:glycosyltransferase family 2 protein [Verrucomicrobiota bacterium]
MLNVLVLMSGTSDAFKAAGFAFPKNLVDIGGKPLVQRVLDHLQPLDGLDARVLCAIRHDENAKHHTGAVIRLIAPRATLVEINGTTAGAACSALLAIEHINNDVPLVIVNGDQLLETDLVAAVQECQQRQLDGGILVFEDVHPRWSFVKCGPDGLVIETAEKRPISRLATAGFYYFARGRDFILATTEMIKKDAQVNGQFYICPCYNELILRQRRIGVRVIPRSAYRSLAAPGDVHAYEAHLAGRHA